MNIKVIIASTLITTFFAGSSAIAEDRGALFEWEWKYNASQTEIDTQEKVNYLAPVVSTEDDKVNYLKTESKEQYLDLDANDFVF